MVCLAMNFSFKDLDTHINKKYSQSLDYLYDRGAKFKPAFIPIY